MSSPRSGGLLYADSGVDSDLAESALAALLPSVRESFLIRSGVGKPLLSIGQFANVLDLGNGVGLAISTDGVGTKALVAQMMGRYDTIGIDCIAMNVNDVICVGAEPIAMTDYLAVEVPDRQLFAELGEGLLRGARLAGITIPGGEVAQVREIVHGVRAGHGFDLVGTCVGLVNTDRIIVGQDIVAGDVVVGLASAGVHSNGLTLARKALFEQAGMAIDDHVPGLDRSVGEELLTPTAIYVQFALEVLRSELSVKAFVHITSEGFLNLARVSAEVGFVLDAVPTPPAIFQAIRSAGDVPDEEMYEVFNMGVGFCVVVPPSDVTAVQALATKHGFESWQIGRAVADPERKVELPNQRLQGRDGRFIRY